MDELIKSHPTLLTVLVQTTPFGQLWPYSLKEEQVSLKD